MYAVFNSKGEYLYITDTLVENDSKLYKDIGEYDIVNDVYIGDFESGKVYVKYSDEFYAASAEETQKASLNSFDKVKVYEADIKKDTIDRIESKYPVYLQLYIVLRELNAKLSRKSKEFTEMFKVIDTEYTLLEKRCKEMREDSDNFIFVADSIESISQYVDGECAKLSEMIDS